MSKLSNELTCRNCGEQAYTHNSKYPKSNCLNGKTGFERIRRTYKKVWDQLLYTRKSDNEEFFLSSISKTPTGQRYFTLEHHKKLGAYQNVSYYKLRKYYV